MSRRILFLADHRPNRSPGQRFRFEQYIPDLEAAGFECRISYLLDERDDQVFYRPGHLWQKAGILAKHYRKRLSDFRDADRTDIVFIFRQALLTRSVYFERRWKQLGKRIIFDFDDSIWLPNTSPHNRSFSLLKNPGKTARIISLADQVFAGNAYLAGYARRFNSEVVIVPTTIDLEQYSPQKSPHNGGPVCIGWSGSLTTIAHFMTVVPVLRRLKEELGEAVRFKVIGDASFRHEALGITGQAWKPESEISDLLDIDIGIMPLPEDPWTEGKCGLKGLQYMALGIPAVMSAVGVNRQIIRNGENGFLAGSEEEMYQALRQLIEDPGLRSRMGAAGRATVEAHYSRQSLRDAYVGYFRRLAGLPSGHL